MKILRIYLKLPPLKGGMEKHIKALSQWQIKNQHDVTLCFNDGDPITDQDIHILPKIKLYKLKPQFLGVFIFYFFVYIYLLRYKKQFEVIHIHGDWSALVLSKILKKITKSKIVVFSLHDQLNTKFTHKVLLTKLVKNINLIFSTGYASAKVLNQTSGKHIVVQPSGVNKVFFEKQVKVFNNTKKKVITVANLLPKKNIYLIFDIAKEMSDVNFEIIGDGPLLKQLNRYIQNSNLKNVQLLGYKNPEEILKAYLYTDCYLLTSFAEGTPTSLMEAMVAGVPIVSSNAGGIDTIVINEENGYIVKNMEKDMYIESLKKVLYNPELTLKISNNNKIKGKTFSWDHVAKRITNLTEDMLNVTKEN